jgi:hypothetical protein
MAIGQREELVQVSNVFIFPFFLRSDFLCGNGALFYMNAALLPVGFANLEHRRFNSLRPADFNQRHENVLDSLAGEKLELDRPSSY